MIPAFPHALRIIVVAGLVAIVGAFLLALGLWLAPDRALAAYLAAVCGAFSTMAGALVLLLVVHAMDAKWPVAIRRTIEAITMAWPIVALTFVPVVLLADRIYIWAQPEELGEQARALVEAKRAWLCTGAFAVRAIAVWVVVAIPIVLLLRWSRAQDERADPLLRTRQRKLSAAMLPAVGLALTLAAFDWIMSLEPTWYSSVFGIDVFAGGFVAAIALATLLVAAFDRPALMGPLVGSSHYYALGRLLLAFIVFWAYIAFFQLFLVWIGNRPEEVEWYLHRSSGGGWRTLAIAIAFAHFVVPFLALLSYRLKRSRTGLALVAAEILVAHVLDLHWKIVPAWRDTHVVHWTDVGALALVYGSATAWVAWRLGGRAVAPRFDEALAEGTRYTSV
jgi:hypothetical protein